MQIHFFRPMVLVLYMGLLKFGKPILIMQLCNVVIAKEEVKELSLVRGCPHLVLGNQCLGTGTKWC